MKEKLLTGLTLFLIAAVSGLLLDQVNSLTQPVIIEAREDRILSAYSALFPMLDSFEATDVDDGSAVSSRVVVYDAQANVLGYIYQVSAVNGHGSIALLVGINGAGVVVDYVELEFNQTPGISAPARKSNYGITFLSQPIERDYEAVDVSIGATNSASTLRDLFAAVSAYHGGSV
jgi:Na+-translocating ferredoxin:NAD+ oxidoreductase RnfG subunit